MNADIETAGAMVTAGLAAHEIDHGAAAAAPANHGAACANCAAPLVGSFCHACGQRSHLHRSLAHLGEEVLHGVLHFDAKAWRTLPLLVAKPGELTRRYIDGQRTRFVSPLALFLFMIFFLFFIGSYFGKGNVNIGNNENVEQARAEVTADTAKARAALAKAEAALAAAKRAGSDTSGPEADIEEARDDLAALAMAANAVGLAKDTQELSAHTRAGATGPSIDFKSDIDFIDTAVEHATKNPELTIYKLKNTAYKFSFLLVPISLPFLWLMFFWKPGLTMYDHAVFSLYSLSFMSLLFAVLFVLKFAGLPGVVAFMLFTVPPVHMFLQLRAAYGLTWGSTLWRTVVLQTVAATVFLLYLALIIFLSM
ncbi:DUF3667 domain-containing protein [Massilia sp. GCM10020059]|uniref:DUF3667 domain-containing protein n=1 Tax=Massilia agrisoli TaxID=2892444 RepID=A0ABS8IU01_9BURK|nr:DUF3667 domain-containing protein [Massilia agrisoli]MCC6072029.1 DUF3667 domain-containing protein [Massilia agrisoli]